jgi:hypothetical protein
LKQNTHMNLKNYPQEITPPLYIQYSRLIAISTVYLVLLSTDAHNTDNGLEHSIPQIHSSTIPHYTFRS